MTTLTIEQRIAEAEKAHSEGRIIQDAWRQDGGSHGRELVCVLAAFGSDIYSSADCPADLMPAWLAKLVPTLGGLIAADDVPWFMGELLVRAKRWQSLDTDAWERVRTGFLIHTIQLAVDEAAKAQSDPKPAYWNQVVDACEQMKRALAGAGDLDEAERAAQAAAETAEAERAAESEAERAVLEEVARAASRAAGAAAGAGEAARSAEPARAASRTAWAVAWAGWAAARAAEAEIAEAALQAAWTAVWAAMAAAGAAAWASGAAEAADAAWAAAETATEEAVSMRVAEALFDIIDTELDAA